MKMIKKLISVSLILTIAMVMGALTNVEKINAAGDDVQFTADTSMPIYTIGTTSASDLVVESGSQVSAIAADTDRVNITLESGSDITFKSASGAIMTVTGCTAAKAVFTPGGTSTMRIQYDSTDCTSAVLTIGTGGLTEANVAASALTASTASTYTVSFRTVNSLSAGDKIKLAFGSGYTIAGSGGTVVVTDTTTGSASAVASSFTSDAATKEVIITLTPAVAASRVLNIVLTTIVTNPSSALMTHTKGAPTMSVLGIDFYTTTSGGVTIDSLADQTPFDRIVELKTGWNVFSPSQELESSTAATVLAPISGSYSAIYTLVWDSTSSTMTWQSPSEIGGIKPLYGYAIYITAGSTVKLPLDFAKETGTNGLEQRIFANNGWHLIGYVGTSGSKVAQTAGNCLDGLRVTGAGGAAAFSSIVDLTGTAAGTDPGDSGENGHSIVSATKDEVAGGSTMLFVKDYGYAISISAASSSLTLTGRRGL